MIFCGDLVMAIDESMAVEELADVVSHNNTMDLCCFGKQGMNHKRQACHGSLMYGCLLFSNKPRAQEPPKQGGGHDDAGSPCRMRVRGGPVRATCA